MKLDPSPFLVSAKHPADLDARPTKLPSLYDKKGDYEDALADRVKRLSKLQQNLYADDRYALLVIFQAMDAAGKDGAIRYVFSGVNPQGIQVFSFKQPSAEELDHDFLWRTTTRLPERGRIGVFNRSYYEEVLVVRVHPEFLGSERLPDQPESLDALWQQRYASIRDHEAHLHRNGTRVVKFYLHLSPEEQRDRFMARLDEPEKNWKFSGGDLEERKQWPAYRRAYADAIDATSTPECPWYVIPADDKKNARLLIAETLVRTLESLDLRYPEGDPDAIQGYRAALQGA